MSVKITIPSYLQPFADNKAVVEVDQNIVGQCLDDLVKQFPDIEKMLFTRNCDLHPYVGIYINGQDAYPEELTRPVKDDDELFILYIIGGG